MMRSAPDGTLIPTYGGQRPAISDYITGADGDPMTRDSEAIPIQLGGGAIAHSLI